MATACLGHDPPFDGAAWLNGTAVTAVKDILGGMNGPEQNRYAERARNGGRNSRQGHTNGIRGPKEKYGHVQGTR